MAEGLADLLADDTGGAPQKIAECLVLTVQIAEEVFRPLGQAEKRLQFKNLSRRIPECRIILSQQFQIFEFSHGTILPSVL